jgi:hypothetical protein
MAIYAPHLKTNIFLALRCAGWVSSPKTEMAYQYRCSSNHLSRENTVHYFIDEMEGDTVRNILEFADYTNIIDEVGLEDNIIENESRISM